MYNKQLLHYLKNNQKLIKFTLITLPDMLNDLMHKVYRDILDSEINVF